MELPNISDGEDKSSPFRNRIRNNYRHIRKWAKRTVTNCFRIYDREIHQYPLAIDYYDGRYCVHYFARMKDEGKIPSEMITEVNEALKSVLNVDEDAIFWRQRMRTKETRQYEKIDESGDFFVVLEFGIKFKVNLCDYLDTGLFLDHRETRRLVGSKAKGKRVLNLFAYTCAFGVHAALGGALSTTNIDLSNTYCAWGKDNFLLNGLTLNQNAIIRADCLKFLDHEIQVGNTYDLIIIDPPTISRSKKMEQLFDIHVDYIDLITKGLNLLSDHGEIIFSTNSRKFAFDEKQFPNCEIKEISNKTRPIDFHDPKIHRCWQIIGRFG